MATTDLSSDLEELLDFCGQMFTWIRAATSMGSGYPDSSTDRAVFYVADALENVGMVAHHLRRDDAQAAAAEAYTVSRAWRAVVSDQLADAPPLTAQYREAFARLLGSDLSALARVSGVLERIAARCSAISASTATAPTP